MGPFCAGSGLEAAEGMAAVKILRETLMIACILIGFIPALIFNVITGRGRTVLLEDSALVGHTIVVLSLISYVAFLTFGW